MRTVLTKIWRTLVPSKMEFKPDEEDYLEKGEKFIYEGFRQFYLALVVVSIVVFGGIAVALAIHGSPMRLSELF